MKRATTVLISSVLMLGLAGCGGNGVAGASTTASAPAGETGAVPTQADTGTAVLPAPSEPVAPATDPAPPAGTQLFRGTSGTFTVVLPSAGTKQAPTKPAKGVTEELALTNEAQGWNFTVLTMGAQVPADTFVQSACLATKAQAEQGGAKVVQTDGQVVALDGVQAGGCRLDDTRPDKSSTAWVLSLTRGQKVYSVVFVAPGTQAEATALRDTVLGSWKWQGAAV